jgi:hypothetical protein
MQTVRCSRDAIPSLSCGTCLALALWLGTSAALAQSVAIPDRDWRGSMSYSMNESRQRPVAVRLVQAVGFTAGTRLVRFGSPLNCNLTLSPQDAAGYRIEVQNGGAYCDRFWGGSATLRLDTVDSASVRIRSDNGETVNLQLHATALAPSPLAGRWSASTDQALRLTVFDTPLSPGGPLLRLSYPAPRDCAVEARYAGPSGQTLVAAFVVNASGYCRRLSDGYATVSGQGGKLALEVFDVNGVRLDAAELTRQP